MNTRTIIAAIAGAVTSFLLGWLVYGILLKDYYASAYVPYEGLMYEMPVLWAIFLGGLAHSFLMSWLFTRMNIMTFTGGLQYGLIINFFLFLSQNLYMYASMNIFSGVSIVAIDILISTVFAGIISGVIALTLGKVGRPAVVAA
jgi:hypothetical protein